MTEIMPLTPDRVDEVVPDRLIRALVEAGWTVVGGRRDAYQRLAPPGADAYRQESVLVPLDPTAPEYGEMMSDAVELLAHYRDVWSSIADAQATSESADSFVVHAESEAPSGMIGWRAGERLFTGFGQVLRAGAKAFVAPLAYFGNRHGRFANTFLDAVLMGQTGVGSFIITAYAPSQQSFAEPSTTYGADTGDRGDGLLLVASAAPGRFSIQGRDVTRTVARALQATTEAIAEARDGAELDVFTRRVGDGVSRELTDALGGMTADTAETEISVGWDPDLPGDDLPTRFAFTRDDREILKEASEHLARPGPAERMVITGVPDLLDQRARHARGVVDIKVISGSAARRLRARFTSDADLDRITGAIRARRAVRVIGDQVREGSTYWLYDARLSAVLGELEPPGT